MEVPHLYKSLKSMKPALRCNDSLNFQLILTLAALAYPIWCTWCHNGHVTGREGPAKAQNNLIDPMYFLTFWNPLDRAISVQYMFLGYPFSAIHLVSHTLTITGVLQKHMSGKAVLIQKFISSFIVLSVQMLWHVLESLFTLPPAMHDLYFINASRLRVFQFQLDSVCGPDRQTKPYVKRPSYIVTLFPKSHQYVLYISRLPAYWNTRQ